MQIFGSVYQQKGATKGLLRDNALLELNCDGIINNGKSSTNGRYKLKNPTGIRECTLRAKINGVWTSGSPLEVIFSSKPRRYDLLIEKPIKSGDTEMYYLRKE